MRSYEEASEHAQPVVRGQLSKGRRPLEPCIAHRGRQLGVKLAAVAPQHAHGALVNVRDIVRCLVS